MIHGIQAVDNLNILAPRGLERRRPAGRTPFENRGPVPEDRVDISEAASRLSAAEDERKTGAAREGELTAEEESRVRQLKQRDQEVKAHERAHMSAGAGVVRGGANFSFTKGPDGRMYATGGDVSVDTSPEKTPEATIRKMQQVRRAAMAPAEPSGQDVKVAANAARSEMKARAEMVKENMEEAKGPDEAKEPGENGPAEATGVQGRGPGETTGVQGRGPGETTGVQGRGPGEATGVQGRGPGETTGVQRPGPGETTGVRGSAPNGINGMAGNEPDGMGRLPGERPDQISGPLANGPDNMRGLPGMYGGNGARNGFSTGVLGGRINMIA